MPDAIVIIIIAATFVLAGMVKGVIGLGLPTVSLGLLTAALDLTSAMLEYELKFVVPNHHLGPIFDFVNLSCRADGAHPAGIVSSIYYDSLRWDALNEKINSDYIKTKFRLRWYRDPGSGAYSDASFAESKHRIGCRRIFESGPQDR